VFVYIPISKTQRGWPVQSKKLLNLHAAPLKVTNYNTDIMLRKAEVWRRNELTTGYLGLKETKQADSTYKNVNPLPIHMDVSVHF